MGKTLQTPPSAAPANQLRAHDTKERKSSLIYVNCSEGNAVPFPEVWRGSNPALQGLTIGLGAPSMSRISRRLTVLVAATDGRGGGL